MIEDELQDLAQETLGAVALVKMEHCVGYDPRDVYWRRNKKYFKPYRNHYAPGPKDLPTWEKLKEQGYAESNESKTQFWLTVSGLAILSAAEKVYIYNDAAKGNEVDAAPDVLQVLLNHSVFCGYGCWIPPSAKSIASAARLPLKLTRETLKYLQDETGEVMHVYEGGIDDEGFPHCTHGYILSKKWFDENPKKFEEAKKKERERMAEIEREVGAKMDAALEDREGAKL